jgi:large subunit ribosomal protein L18
MNRVLDKQRRRTRRKTRIRKKILGTSLRPRITVFKSNRHVYVQVVDDSKGVTIASGAGLEKEMRGLRPTVENAAKLGELVGARLKEKGIGTVVFDRNGYLYHGIVKAVADGVRKSGIEL